MNTSVGGLPLSLVVIVGPLGRTEEGQDWCDSAEVEVKVGVSTGDEPHHEIRLS